MTGLIFLIIFMPIAAAFAVFSIGTRSKKGCGLLLTGTVAAEFLLAVWLLLRYIPTEQTGAALDGICAMGLTFTVDGFRVIYVSIAAFIWLMAGLLCPEYFAQSTRENRYYFFQLVTLGATQAILLSADLYTTFVFFEVMSLCSFVWVAQEETENALRAAGTYLAVSVMGGLVMLMGLFLLYQQTGTLVIGQLSQACQGKNVYAAALCLFAGFGAKAGAFPLHIWLPKAYPAAPTPATVLLSAMLSKTGIFGILIISCCLLAGDELWGSFVLVTGVFTMLLGAVLALFSVDMKRTLACSSASQIGFILVGVGMMGLLGEEKLLAARGAFLHMVNHSLFKLLLFLAAAVIGMRMGSLELNHIRGCGRKNPVLAGCFLMGALGIGGVPLWSGYVSKSLLHESIVEYIEKIEQGEVAALLLTVENLKVIEWIFLFSGGLTVAYMCKLFVAVFVENGSGTQAWNMSRLSTGVLGVCAAIIPLLGMFPGALMEPMAEMAGSFLGVFHEGHPVHYFAWTNLKGSLISLGIGAAVYLLVVRGWMMEKQPDGTRKYVDRWPAWLDLEDLVYRPLLLRILPGIFGWVCAVLDRLPEMLFKGMMAVGSFAVGVMDILMDGIVIFLRKTVYRDSPREHELEEGNALTHTIGVLLNTMEQLFNKSIWKHHVHKKDLEHWFVLKYTSFKENATVIGRSLSYGLVSFCLGLCATLLYLLVSAFL